MTRLLEVVGVGDDGQLWHTNRDSLGPEGRNWQPDFDEVKTKPLLGPTRFTAVGCAIVNGELHVVGVGNDRQLWHTFRDTNGIWQQWFGPVQDQSAGGAANYTAVACAEVNGELQVVGLVMMGSCGTRSAMHPVTGSRCFTGSRTSRQAVRRVSRPSVAQGREAAQAGNRRCSD